MRWPIALVLMMAAIALLFRWSPNRHQPAWSWLAFGSTVSVLLWSLATLGLGLFFQASTTFSTTYGPLAGMIALLLWALLSSIAILFGAAIAVQLEAVRRARPRRRTRRKVGVGRPGRAHRRWPAPPDDVADRLVPDARANGKSRPPSSTDVTPTDPRGPKATTGTSSSTAPSTSRACTRCCASATPATGCASPTGRATPTSGSTARHRGGRRCSPSSRPRRNVRGLLWRSHPEAMNFGEGKNLASRG